MKRFGDVDLAVKLNYKYLCGILTVNSHKVISLTLSVKYGKKAFAIIIIFFRYNKKIHFISNFFFMMS